MPLIESLHPDDWTLALERVLARLPEAERPAQVRHCLQLLADGLLDPRGIWVARTDDQIVGVQVCVPLAGAACLFWLPVAETAAARPLVQAGLDWSRKIGCKIVMAVVDPLDLPFAEPLIGCGFRPITRMHQLAHRLDGVGDEPSPALHYESYRPSLRPLFAAILERTYEASLDCPELNGRRTAAEILAGHQGQGTFRPQFWWLAYNGATPIGVVLLIEMPEGASWELAYLGIVPESRRRGFGRAMTLHALHALQAQPATRLLLAVDERNTPALRLYESLGFVEIECHEVLLYFW